MLREARLQGPGGLRGNFDSRRTPTLLWAVEPKPAGRRQEATRKCTPGDKGVESGPSQDLPSPSPLSKSQRTHLFSLRELCFFPKAYPYLEC